MEDLSGLDWTSSNSQTTKKPPPASSSSTFATLRPTPPASGRSTPLGGGVSNPPSKPGTPANDTFSDLVTFNSSNSSKNLSLQEQQKRLLQQKEEREIARRKQINEQYKGDDEHFWNNLGSGRSTPAPRFQPQELVGSVGTSANIEGEDDFLAVFNSTGTVQSTTNATEAKIQYNGHAAGSVRARSRPSGSLFSSEESGFDFADDEDD